MKNKAALLGTMLSMGSSIEWEKQAFEAFGNNESLYTGKAHSTPTKTQLSKKQAKARAKSKAARKARKK